MAEIVFVGVSTSSSLVHLAMRLWQAVLGVPCLVRGVDIGLDADDDRYVELLSGLLSDDSVSGAVVTTHKVRMFRAGRAHFTYLDPLALACKEVNAIRRTADGLFGWARDPVSVGRVVDRIWPDSQGEVVCLGAGGTARALAQHYRGDLRFLRHALNQRQNRALEAHDGWELFCHGWAAALSVVLELPDSATIGDRFAEATQSLRPLHD